MEQHDRQFEKPTDDYLRIATVSPEVAIAAPAKNIETLAAAYEAAKQEEAELVVTPELSLTGYSTADLLHNTHVLERNEACLQTLAEKTVGGPAMLVGVPLRKNSVLYNCCAVLAEGEIKGIIPKVNLPNYKEFYEERWFTSGAGVVDETITVGDQEVPFGTDLLFDINGTKVAAEICEDLFAPMSPGTSSALAGAEVVANLSASNEIIGKAGYRKTLVSGFSGKLICGYVYCSAGKGESVADVIYGGHQLVGENARLVAETPPLSDTEAPLVYDIDRTYLEHDRITNNVFGNQAKQLQQTTQFRTVAIRVPSPTDQALRRHIDPLPFVPKNPETLNQRCEEIFRELSSAVAQRTKDAGSEGIVLGLSGGLDSTLALLTALEAVKRLDVSNDFIHTITMPGPASSERTQDNATLLAEALGTTHKVIPIGDMARTLLASIGHDLETEDITYENTQARMRKSVTMNYANMIHGFDLGTGDMSEITIGWSTYNGDHMSMYNPNGGVPKTLVKHLVKWYAENRADAAGRAVLLDILDTPISPELTGKGDLSQTTEDIVGPYPLIDFFTYEHLRYGSRPSKIGYLACRAFEGVYSESEINRRLGQFFVRHTKSQWKRDVTTNTIKLGTVSESSRGDLRMAANTDPEWHE